VVAERQAQNARLRLASPMRPRVDQADVDGLGLFDAHRSPRLL
jgi:hypothetical protein